MRNVPPRKTGKPIPEVVAFGKRVRELRTVREMTQEGLAEAAGLNSVQISHLENGRNEPKLTTILALAKAFRMTASELLRPFK
jgi:transcriptional regulator with XRE-family HTH domain